MIDLNEPVLTPVKQRSYSTFLPFLIVLVTLTLGSLKDIVTLLQARAAVRTEQVRADNYLAEAGKQALFMNSLREDLNKLSATDPVAAQVVADFAPPAATSPAPSDTSK